MYSRDPNKNYNEISYALYRKRGNPKANTRIACPHCLEASYDLIYNKKSIRYAPHYYWRYYKCLHCKLTYWVGVHYETNETIIPSLPPTNRGFYQHAVLYTFDDIRNGCYDRGDYKYIPIKTPQDADMVVGELFTHWLKVNQYGFKGFDNDRKVQMFKRLHKMYKDTLVTSESNNLPNEGVSENGHDDQQGLPQG